MFFSHTPIDSLSLSFYIYKYIGDVSLLAYIQTELAEKMAREEEEKGIVNGQHSRSVEGEGEEEGVNRLGAVMGFLYSSYIVLFMLISFLVGRILDHYFEKGEKGQ